MESPALCQLSYYPNEGIVTDERALSIARRINPTPTSRVCDKITAIAELSEILSLAEAADLAGLSPGRLRQLIEEGRLPGKKIGNSWAILSRDLDGFLGKSRGAGRPDERTALAGRLFIDLRGMSPIHINLIGQLPEITLWFKADNRSALEVELDRLLVEVWFGQPVTEGAVLNRYALRPNSWDDSIRFHKYLSRERADILVQRLGTQDPPGGSTDMRLQLTAYFNTPLGSVVVYNGMITRQKGEYPVQLPPPRDLGRDPLASKQIPG